MERLYDNPERVILIGGIFMYISGTDVRFTTLTNDEVRLDISDIRSAERVYGFYGFAMSINTKSGSHYMAKGSDSEFKKLEDKLW